MRKDGSGRVWRIMSLATGTFRDEVFGYRKNAETFAKELANRQGLYAVVSDKRGRER